MKHILASTTHGFKVQTSQMLDFYAIFKNSQDLAQNNSNTIANKFKHVGASLVQ